VENQIVALTSVSDVYPMYQDQFSNNWTK